MGNKRTRDRNWWSSCWNIKCINICPCLLYTSTLQHFYFVEDFIFLVFMGSEKVVVCNPEGKVIISAVDVIKAVCVTVRSLISAVEPLNHLLEWAVFCRNRIVVGKPNDLSDFEGKV